MTGRRWVSLRDAWQSCLYGKDGFYRREGPADHFRTSSHVGPVFARAVLALLRRHDLHGVTDLGAGAGELLRALHALDPELALTGIDVRPRPADLPTPIAWRTDIPQRLDGLVFANELLDNIACTVAELDRNGRVREVEVQLQTGAQRRGQQIDGPEAAWLDRWWPLESAGSRAEIGLARDDWWAAVCASMHGRGLAVAVDYGHVVDSRPRRGSLASYRRGRLGPPAYDGQHDVTAHVAVDSLADRVGAALARQRDVLLDLGVSDARPPFGLATSDPRSYLRQLAVAGEAAELVASPGLGDFWWLTTEPPADGSSLGWDR